MNQAVSVQDGENARLFKDVVGFPFERNRGSFGGVVEDLIPHFHREGHVRPLLADQFAFSHLLDLAQEVRRGRDWRRRRGRRNVGCGLRGRRRRRGSRGGTVGMGLDQHTRSKQKHGKLLWGKEGRGKDDQTP